MIKKIFEIMQYLYPIKCDHLYEQSGEILEKIRRLRDCGDRRIIKLLQTFNIHEMAQCQKCGKWTGFKYN